LPVSDRAWADLAKAAERMIEASGSPRLLSVRARELDNIVLRSYGLTERVRQAITRHFCGFVAPEGSVRYRQTPAALSPSDSAAVRTFGAVLGVDATSALRLWVPGVTSEEGTLQPVPNRFLGWHCVEGATFEVSINGALSDAKYFFQSRSYQAFAESKPVIPGPVDRKW
jgi:hypothetical protein